VDCNKEGQYGYKDNSWMMSETKDTKDNVSTYKFFNLFFHL
jgi:hypothetical protein